MILIAPEVVIIIILSTIDAALLVNIAQVDVTDGSANAAQYKQDEAKRCRYDGHHIEGNDLKHTRKYNLCRVLLCNNLYFVKLLLLINNKTPIVMRVNESG